VASESAAGERSYNVADLVTMAVQRDGEHPALVDGRDGRTLRWGQIEALVNVLAARLLEAGLRPGERVLIKLPTGVEWCVALFGVLRAGGVAVPAPVDAPRYVIDHMYADSGAKYVIATPDLAVEGTDAAVTPADPAVVADGTDATGTDGPSSPPGGSPYTPVYLRVPTENDVSSADGGPVAPVAGGEDLAVLCYTSGTSGASRGVMLSHRALLANVEQCAEIRPPVVSAADRVLLALPLYHAYGLGPGLLQPTGAAATVVLAERFDPAEIVDMVERHRVTTVVGVPPMYGALLGLGAQRLRAGLATVRLLTSGAAPLDTETARAVTEATGLSVYEGYGLTETAPVVTSTLVAGQAKPGSVGRPIPGVEVRLVDSDGGALPEPDETGDERGGTGLVSVRGGNLFSGYWPDGAHGPDEEGWFRTGDVGYLDPDGDLHLLDRAGDLIIVNGFNVYPHEVEKVLTELEGVREAAAVGVPNERTGEAVHAFVVLEPEATADAEELLRHCAQRLARFKVPDRIEFVEELPHSVTGKLARRALGARRDTKAAS
jgi:long-chain acyl-CoA synthetase